MNVGVYGGPAGAKGQRSRRKPARRQHPDRPASSATADFFYGDHGDDDDDDFYHEDQGMPVIQQERASSSLGLVGGVMGPISREHPGSLPVRAVSAAPLRNKNGMQPGTRGAAGSAAGGSTSASGSFLLSGFPKAHPGALPGGPADPAHLLALLSEITSPSAGTVPRKQSAKLPAGTRGASAGAAALAPASTIRSPFLAKPAGLSERQAKELQKKRDKHLAKAVLAEKLDEERTRKKERLVSLWLDGDEAVVGENNKRSSGSGKDPMPWNGQNNAKKEGFDGGQFFGRHGKKFDESDVEDASAVLLETSVLTIEAENNETGESVAKRLRAMVGLAHGSGTSAGHRDRGSGDGEYGSSPGVVDGGRSDLANRGSGPTSKSLTFQALGSKSPLRAQQHLRQASSSPRQHLAPLRAGAGAGPSSAGLVKLDKGMSAAYRVVRSAVRAASGVPKRHVVVFPNILNPLDPLEAVLNVAAQGGHDTAFLLLAHPGQDGST
jgi:hypothetical protein